MYTNQVHGEALLALVHSSAEDALDGRRIVDLLHVLVGNVHVFEDNVAQLAMGALVAQADYRVIFLARSDGGGFFLPEVRVWKGRRKGEEFTWSSIPWSTFWLAVDFNLIENLSHSHRLWTMF